MPYAFGQRCWCPLHSGSLARQQRGVRKLARADDGGGDVHDAHEPRQPARHQVRDAQEGIVAAQPAGVGQHHALLAVKRVRVVVVGDADGHHVARAQVRVDLAPQLAEVGQRGNTHPVDEALVRLGASRDVAAAAQRRVGGVCERAGVEVLRRVVAVAVLHVRLERDALRADGQRTRRRRALRRDRHLVRVVEVGPGDEATGVDERALVARQVLLGVAVVGVLLAVSLRQLDVAAALDVPAMVLIHAYDFIVHVYWPVYVFVNSDVDCALGVVGILPDVIQPGFIVFE
mmetsp:Transcript_36599/g.92441  ORF Transcript_36599/g.92441 Transcript_36599/m.92441 type:complete len:288 (-) Transcript_36599:277-1140(-)